jgi:hypothetical protein
MSINVSCGGHALYRSLQWGILKTITKLLEIVQFWRTFQEHSEICHKRLQNSKTLSIEYCHPGTILTDEAHSHSPFSTFKWGTLNSSGIEVRVKYEANIPLTALWICIHRAAGLNATCLSTSNWNVPVAYTCTVSVKRMGCAFSFSLIRPIIPVDYI